MESLEFINLDKYEIINSAGHSSKGNQLKWNKENEWFKADYMGYEGLSEIMVSKLLELSNITGYVKYNFVEIEYKGVKYPGCKSNDFLNDKEELITLQKLFRQYTGKNLVKEIIKFSNIRDRIIFVVENVKKFTDINNFGEYLSILLTTDAFFLNEDRHTNNIAFIYNTDTEKYKLCPYFDYGLSLFSDMTTDFRRDISLEECYEKIEAKPFSRNFDEQLDEVEILYGAHVHFTFSIKDVINELEKYRGIYDEVILKRVENILRLQIRKYQYLF